METEDKEQGPWSRGSPGRSGLTIARQFVYAAICAGLEEETSGQKAGREDRVVCRRLCDLLQRQCRRGNDRDAAADGAAQTHGQRGEDTHPAAAGGAIRFSGLQLRTVLLTQDGTGLFVPATGEEKSPAHHRGDPGGDRTQGSVAGGRRTGEGDQSQADRLGELFQPWAGQQSLSCD